MPAPLGIAALGLIKRCQMSDVRCQIFDATY